MDMTMPSSLEPAQPVVSSSGFFLFRPWSHTDRRHVLKLLSSSFDKKSLVKEALTRVETPGAQACFLEPIECLDLGKVIRSDKKREEKYLRPGFRGFKPKHFKFVAVSWSPRYPDELKVESRSMVMLRDAYLFATTEQEIHRDRGRLFCVMRVLSPKTATLSP